MNGNKNTGYNVDLEYDLWLQEQADKLKSRSFAELDIDNLVEELESLVRGEKSAVESFAYQIILHLLLIDYWTTESERNRNQRCDPSEVSSDWERASRDWRAEINGFQYQLQSKLTTNLNNHLNNNLAKIYKKAKKGAELKTGLTSNTFPISCPYKLV